MASTKHHIADAVQTLLSERLDEQLDVMGDKNDLAGRVEVTPVDRSALQTMVRVKPEFGPTQYFLVKVSEVM